VAGLHAEDHLLRLRRPFVVEEEAAVDAVVGALLLLHRPGAHESKRLPLKLVRVARGERMSLREQGDPLEVV
jgi:hypothetical protein